jgi:hypothetical protein
MRMEVVAGRDDEPLALAERGGPRKQRRGVTVGAQPEMDEVEWPVFVKQAVIHVSGQIDGVAGVPHRMDVAGPDRIEERLARHALVRVRVVDRYPPLVPEEHLDPIPVDFGTGKELVAPSGGRATRQSQRRRHLLDEQVGECPGNIVDDANLAPQAHGVLHVSP